MAGSGTNAEALTHIARGDAILGARLSIGQPASLEQLEGASAAYEAAIAADPKSVVPWTRLGMAQIRGFSAGVLKERATEMLHRAEAVMLEALRLNDKDNDARAVLSRVGATRVPSCDRAGPGGSALALADEHFAAGRREEALREYERAVELEPSNFGAWKYAGNCLHGMKRYPEAEVRFRKAVEIEPLDPQAHLFLSSALVQQGKGGEAWGAVMEAIAAHPLYWSAWFRLDDWSGKKPLRRFRLDDPSPSSPGIVHRGCAAYVAAVKASRAAKESPFRIELNGLAALAAVTASAEPSGLPWEYFFLPRMAEHGDLEAAVFVLRYQESMRPEFEAWKALPRALAHAGGARDQHRRAIGAAGGTSDWHVSHAGPQPALLTGGAASFGRCLAVHLRKKCASIPSDTRFHAGRGRT